MKKIFTPASEFIENLEKICFPLYYKHSDVFSRFNSSTTQSCVSRLHCVRVINIKMPAISESSLEKSHLVLNHVYMEFYETFTLRYV